MCAIFSDNLYIMRDTSLNSSFQVSTLNYGDIITTYKDKRITEIEADSVLMMTMMAMITTDGGR